jgi:hypothetical protein
MTTNTQKYGVRCQVSGGYTGTRSAWLKTGADSRVAEFDTRAEAAAEAERLTARGRAPRRVAGTAEFSYWAEPL